jgi:hypothetical protein
MQDFDVIREARELKTQLSYSKNIGFFMGAGSSCALGLPNIAQLTGKIEQELTEPLLGLFKRVKKDLEIKYPSEKISIEDILNQTRRIREITAEREDSNFDGITGIESRQLDVQICRIIYNILTDAEAIADLTVPKRFLSWVSMQNREQSKEIFTTNYDLLIERSLESIRVPYFDGFVGSYEPFFWQESVERFVRKADLTENWIRLWKIHGSLSWFWKKSSSGSHKVVRLGKIEKIEEEKSEIVIYPSKDKYDSSRRQPFLVYFDRLRNYLLSGELLFIFTGYSFLDQHINEIIFNCLRQNNRLSIIVFFYADYEVERLHQIASGYLNLTAFGPTKAIVNGVLGKLNFVEAYLKLKENTNTYWDNENGKMLLGDFNHLVNFLVENSGRSGEIEVAVNEN